MATVVARRTLAWAVMLSWSLAPLSSAARRSSKVGAGSRLRLSVKLRLAWPAPPASSALSLPATSFWVASTLMLPSPRMAAVTASMA